MHTHGGKDVRLCKTQENGRQNHPSLKLYSARTTMFTRFRLDDSCYICNGNNDIFSSVSRSVTFIKYLCIFNSSTMMVANLSHLHHLSVLSLPLDFVAIIILSY